MNAKTSTTSYMPPEWAFEFHGHRCPAMPMGYRTAIAAMEKLGVEKAHDGQLAALIELGEDHCATCFGDGVQVATGCTFGKGNIKKLNYGKWGLTLIDKKNGKAVRVTPKAEAMMKSKQSEFMKMRKSGIPASQVPASVADPLVNFITTAKSEDILHIGEVFDYQWENAPDAFDGFICESCGEMTVTTYGRIKDGKHVCIPCSGYKK
jgi:formylmethanofuran dehydrogenase subunit E